MINLKISFVILTRNDENKLEKCLLSIQKFADEILVIDEFSSDKTLEIAKKFNAILIQNKNSLDFAEARNLGMKNAKNDWVFFVDSDEELVQISNSETVAYKIKRRDYMWGKEIKHGENGNWEKIRLVRRDSGKWIGKVHEEFIFNSSRERSRPFPTNEIYLKHFHNQSISAFLNDTNIYSDLRAKELFENGVKSNIFQICLYPTAKFFVDYFWLLGFLDGVPGFIIAAMMSLYSFLTRAKLFVRGQVVRPVPTK